MALVNQHYDPIVHSHTQCQRGANWYFDRVIQTTQNEQLYRGDFSPLLYNVKRSIANGLDLLNDLNDLLVFPWLA